MAVLPEQRQRILMLAFVYIVMPISKTETETRKITIEVPKSASAKDVRLLVKKLFSFNVKKYYGKSKNFPMARIKWRATA